ncbi:MAG: hypothetical protein R3E64_16075 [Halioglobus sp.]
MAQLNAAISNTVPVRTLNWQVAFSFLAIAAQPTEVSLTLTSLGVFHLVYVNTATAGAARRVSPPSLLFKGGTAAVSSAQAIGIST